jgi:hypothetical protein
MSSSTWLPERDASLPGGHLVGSDPGNKPGKDVADGPDVTERLAELSGSEELPWRIGQVMNDARIEVIELRDLLHKRGNEANAIQLRTLLLESLVGAADVCIRALQQGTVDREADERYRRLWAELFEGYSAP